jgi:hypothetical protein
MNHIEKRYYKATKDFSMFDVIRSCIEKDNKKCAYSLLDYCNNNLIDCDDSPLLSYNKGECMSIAYWLSSELLIDWCVKKGFIQEKSAQDMKEAKHNNILRHINSSLMRELRHLKGNLDLQNKIYTIIDDKLDEFKFDSEVIQDYRNLKLLSFDTSGTKLKVEIKFDDHYGYESVEGDITFIL